MRRPRRKTSASESRSFNRGPEARRLHILPHLWFRNTWAWGAAPGPPPQIVRGDRTDAWEESDRRRRRPRSPAGSDVRLPARAAASVRAGRRHDAVHRQRDERGRVSTAAAARRRAADVKDAFHRHIVNGEDVRQSANSAGRRLPALRPPRCRPAGRRSGCCGSTADPVDDPLADVERIVAARRPRPTSSTRPSTRRRPAPTSGCVQRQALAGLLWTKQIYIFDVHDWLDGDNPLAPPPESRRHDAQLALAAPQLDARAVDAGQVGVPVVRRVGPRVPVRHAVRSSTPSSPRSSSGCCCSSSSSIPTGRSPPTSGSSPTSIRRCTPGRCWRVYNMDRMRTRPRRPRRSSSSASTSC